MKTTEEQVTELRMRVIALEAQMKELYKTIDVMKDTLDACEE